jgi:hypothetical protein
MNTDEHRFPIQLPEPVLLRVCAAIGRWMMDEAFGSTAEKVAGRAAMGGALFVIRCAAPDQFSRIVTDLGIESAAADDLIANVAGDILPADTDTPTTIPADTHEPVTLDI